MSETAPMPAGDFHSVNRSGERFSRESFGHQTESFVAESLVDLPTIEAVEMATEQEDLAEKVDFWVKFKDWDAPVGVQLSLSQNPERMARKINDFPMRVTKHDTPESIIKGEGKACWAVLVTGPLAEYGKHFDTYIAMREAQKGPKPSQIIPGYLIADVYRQILKGHSEALGQDQPRLREEFLATVARHSEKIH